MAAGKLGKAASTTRELTGLSVTLASNAVVGRLLLSFFTYDWIASPTATVNTSDGWRIQLAQEGGTNPDLTSLVVAYKIAHGAGDSRDTCTWTMGGGLDDTCAAVIVELDDDFGSGPVIASAGSRITSVGRSVASGSIRAPANGIAVAALSVSDANNWDASGSDGPLATWSNSFVEYPRSYTFGSDGITAEDAALSIATKSVSLDDTVTTTATEADGAGSSSMAALILLVITPPPLPAVGSLAYYNGTVWV